MVNRQLCPKYSECREKPSFIVTFSLTPPLSPWERVCMAIPEAYCRSGVFADERRFRGVYGETRGMPSLPLPPGEGVYGDT